MFAKVWCHRELWKRRRPVADEDTGRECGADAIFSFHSFMTVASPPVRPWLGAFREPYVAVPKDLYSGGARADLINGQPLYKANQISMCIIITNPFTLSGSPHSKTNKEIILTSVSGVHKQLFRFLFTPWILGYVYWVISREINENKCIFQIHV